MYENLKDEFHYYLAHQDEFVSRYNGKVIVLKNHEVIGVYDGEFAAAKETLKTHADGTFIVQRVTPGEEAYTVMIASDCVLSPI